MSNTIGNGEVSEETKETIKAIQEKLTPSTLGTPIEEVAANIEKYVVPQYRSNIAGAYYTRQDWLDSVRAGNLERHTSNPHTREFYSVGNTIILYGLTNGADYDENGVKLIEQLNVPFCDVFMQIDGELRLIAVTTSLVTEGTTELPE